MITPRLFTQPWLTLASEQSVSTVPCRTIDLILARSPETPPLPLPSGWLDVVEVGAEAFYNEAVLNIANDADDEGLLTEAEGITSYVEIHTTGDWMIALKLRTAIQETIQDNAAFGVFSRPAGHSLSAGDWRSRFHQHRQDQPGDFLSRLQGGRRDRLAGGFAALRSTVKPSFHLNLGHDRTGGVFVTGGVQPEIRRQS